MDGIIALYKPRGMTSHDCVNQVRRLLRTKKVGHSGTLDPQVDGVLPICVGSATKVVDYLLMHDKVYQGHVTLGFATQTEDLDGEVVEKTPLKQAFSSDQIDTAMGHLTGDIEQVPPMYSAVKVNGRKLYEYAREGKNVDRPVRHVQIKAFKRLATPQFDRATRTQTIAFEVTCSKGTYIRTLCVMLGEKLGVAAVMTDLTRLASGGFTLDETVSLSELQRAVETSHTDFLYPLDRALSAYPQVALTADLWQGVKNGVWLKVAEVDREDPVVALSYNGSIKCLYQKKGPVYKPLKMFSTR